MPTFFIFIKNWLSTIYHYVKLTVFFSFYYNKKIADILEMSAIFYFFYILAKTSHLSFAVSPFTIK